MNKVAQYSKLEAQGFKFEGYEYDWNVQKLQKYLELTTGKEVKLVRERTDTPGFKMWSVWTRR